jgi:hypothetical protein
MKYIIKNNQLQVLGNHIQSLIDSSLNSIREESEEWGLGEMDDLDEIDSIENITIDRILPYTGTNVYIDIYSNTDRVDFDNVRAEIQYRLEQWIPNIKLFINEIYY